MFNKQHATCESDRLVGKCVFVCLNFIAHFPAGIGGVEVRASRPGAVEEEELRGQELDLGEVGKITGKARAPEDTPDLEGMEGRVLHLYSLILLCCLFLLS